MTLQLLSEGSLDQVAVGRKRGDTMHWYDQMDFDDTNTDT